MNKDITPINKDGKPHGYWEYYYANGNLTYKGNFINGQEDGLWEWYHSNGQLYSKEYYI